MTRTSSPSLRHTRTIACSSVCTKEIRHDCADKIEKKDSSRRRDARKATTANKPRRISTLGAKKKSGKRATAKAAVQKKLSANSKSAGKKPATGSTKQKPASKKATREKKGAALGRPRPSDAPKPYALKPITPRPGQDGDEIAGPKGRGLLASAIESTFASTEGKKVSRSRKRS